MRDVRGRAKLKRIKSRFSILSLGAVVTLTAAVGLIRSFSTHPLKLEETTDSPGFVVPQVPSEFQKPFMLSEKGGANARLVDGPEMYINAYRAGWRDCRISFLIGQQLCA